MRNKYSKHACISERKIQDITRYFAADLTALQTAIANDDPDGWIGHHGFPIEFDDGQVFTYFTGEPIGQGGFAFEYLGAFGSKFEVIQAIKRAPLAAVF